MLNSVKNAFVDKFLQHILDGNKGSNLLTVLLLPLVGAKIDWLLAFQGLQFNDVAAAAELAKVVGFLVLGVFGYFVGKK
jgi:hypothetical protein